MTTATEVIPRSPAISLSLRWLRRNRLAAIGGAILLLWIVLLVAGPLITPYSPIEQNMDHRFAPPSAMFPFGTDRLGRDVLTRVIYGARISLPVAVLLVALSMVIGSVVGSISSYAGGWSDTLVQRVVEITLAFPPIILAMAIAAALGSGLTSSVIAIVAVSWPNYARLVRGEVMQARQMEYVQASRVIGSPWWRILSRTILPNIFSPIMVYASLDLGSALLLFSGLSFLGLGATPPAPEWGAMIADGATTFERWWLATAPGVALLSAVLGFNFLGDGIRDWLDPRLRSR